MASSNQAKRILTQGKKFSTSTSNKRTRPISENDVKIQETDDSQEESSQQMNAYQSGKQDKRQKLIRPNAFLSFRIRNQQIIDHASKLQKEIIESNSLLSKASISIPTLHITLMVFALKTDEDKQRARQSLVDVCHQIALAKLPSPQITFTGLSHFNHKVLYIDPVKDAHLDVLTRIAEICRETYEKNGILSTDDRPFNPHLTLFKLSKARDLHRKGIKKIDQCWSSKYIDHHFGIENFRSLHLCNMMKKQNDGYYEIIHEQNLFNDGPDSFHRSSTTNLTNEIGTVIKIDNFIRSTVQVNENVERTSDEQQGITAETSVIDESSPLIQHERPTYEEAFSGLASFFHCSHSSQCCSCCSII